MKHALLIASVACLASAGGTAALCGDAVDPLTRPLEFGDSAHWNQPQPPGRIFGNTYYVGVGGLSSILIQGSAGLILLDGDLPQSAPLIEAHIRSLGFDLKDVKYILNSHAHADHAGGIAALQRDSAAVALASPSGARALREGHVVADDPQVGFTRAAAFPAVAQVREVADGEVVRLGDLAITAHFTPGHTPGSTTWTWQSCEATRCLHMVYADSLNALAGPGFHYLADPSHGDLTPGFRASIRRVADLPCDILITVHPDLADIIGKLERARVGATPNPFIDSQACRRYAAAAEVRLDAQIAQEKAAAP